MPPAADPEPAPFTLRGRTVGAGSPLVAVPLVARTVEGLVEAARRVDGHPVDLVEWRVDHLVPRIGPTADPARLRDAAACLVEAVGERPVLVTYRTTGQGGEGAAAPGEVLDLLAALAGQPGLDLFDVEADHPLRDEALALVREAGVLSLVSEHDWVGQQAPAALAERVRALRATGADAVKIATTPADAAEASDLLGVLARCAPEGAPLALLGMGEAGRLTRLVGPACGSFLTFAHLGELSAPGQMPVSLVAATVDALRNGARPLTTHSP